MAGGCGVLCYAVLVGACRVRPCFCVSRVALGRCGRRGWNAVRVCEVGLVLIISAAVMLLC